MATEATITTKPTILVFCGGVGLVSYAAQECNYQAMGCIDIADIPAQSYKVNYPDTPFLQESIRKISAEAICRYFQILPRELDLLQISTPCTGFSSTGEFEPTHADNELFLIAMYQALQLLPKVILFENVPGMTWNKMESTFNMVATFFKRFKESYHVDALIMNSNDFGDPQSRDRLFIQCTRKDVGVPRWPLPDRPNSRKVIADCLPNVDYIVSTNFGERVYEKDEAAPTITASANIKVGENGTERAITPRELAQLSSLPDSFKLVGTEAEQIRGVGNGVPVMMMKALLLAIKYDVLGYPRLADTNLRTVPTNLIGQTGFILYDGPSLLTGERIVAIITNDSANEKTGNMAQLWILPADTNPVSAIETGKDVSVCGDCKLRQFKNGACYVQVGKAPRHVWETWKKGIYGFLPVSEYHIYIGVPIRFGAYGDPSAIPTEIHEQLRCFASNTTGYTHQWKKAEAMTLQQFCMASVDSKEEYTEANNSGWRTFRVMDAEDTLMPGEILCPNLTSGIQCRDCNLCTGTSLQAKNIAIHVHGAHKRKFKSIKEAKYKYESVGVDVAQISSKEVDVALEHPHRAEETSIKRSDKIINSLEILKMKFESLDFTGKWEDFLGQPSVNFHCVIYGLPGQGKSTFAVQFAKYLADTFGCVLYVSGEEGISKTFFDKLSNNGAGSGMFYVADIHCYSEIISEIDPTLYRFIFFDSLDTLYLGPDEMRRIRHHFSNSAIITIAQSTKLGLMRGSNELQHDADVVIRVNDGYAVTAKNRFSITAGYNIFPAAPKE